MVCQFYGRPVEDEHIHPFGLQVMCKRMREAGPGLLAIGWMIQQYRQVVVAHWPDFAAHLRAEQVNQADLGEINHQAGDVLG